MTDNPYMQRALELAHIAAQNGEVPVGAVIVDAKGSVISEAANETEAAHDPTAHAEMLAIRTACKTTGSERLIDCDMYVTLEPCPMCAQAISFARIRRLYFGAFDPKGGGVENGPRIYTQPTCHHKPEVISGLQETASADLLKNFFQAKRK